MRHRYDCRSDLFVYLLIFSRLWSNVFFRLYLALWCCGRLLTGWWWTGSWADWPSRGHADNRYWSIQIIVSSHFPPFPQCVASGALVPGRREEEPAWRRWRCWRCPFFLQQAGLQLHRGAEPDRAGQNVTKRLDCWCLSPSNNNLSKHSVPYLSPMPGSVANGHAEYGVGDMCAKYYVFSEDIVILQVRQCGFCSN